MSRQQMAIFILIKIKPFPVMVELMGHAVCAIVLKLSLFLYPLNLAYDWSIWE